MATTQLSARLTQAGTASAYSARGYVKWSQSPGASLTSSSQSQSPTTSQLPTAVATAAASRKSSLPTAITLGPATDESKSALSSSSASAARTQQQDIKLYLRFFTFMMILMGIHSFLDMILWLPTLYLLAVTFIHLIFGGYNSSLKFCGFRTFALAATVYTLFHSVVDDSKSFYSAGILLYFIFGSRNDLLSPSSAYRSACSLDTVQEVKGHHEHKAPEARLSLSLVISQIDSAPGSVRIDTPVQDCAFVVATATAPALSSITAGYRDHCHSSDCGVFRRVQQG